MSTHKLLLVCCIAGLLFICQAQDSDSSASEAAETPDSQTEHAASPVASKGPKITVDSATASVSGPGDNDVKSKGAFGTQLLKNVKLGEKDTLEVSFKAGGVLKPQQAMLMLTSTDGLTAYAVAKAKKEGAHTITITPALVDKQIGSPGGAFKVTLLLGDPSASLGVQWELGTVQLPEGDSSKAGPRFLTASQQPMASVQPEIIHMFRAPGKKPPAAVSLAFTVLALAPLAGLVITLGALGVNFQGMPSGEDRIWVLLFHGSIAALLGLYLLFWLQLNLAQTLPLALLLGLVVASTGYKALSATATARLGTAAKVAAGEVKKIN